MIVTKKEIESALNNYRLGRLESYCVPKQGLLNKVVFLKTTKGRYVLKVALVNEGTLGYVLGLLDHIKMKTAPRPFLTRDKKLYSVCYGHKAFVYPFISGNIPKRLSSRMIGEIGRFLAEYHKRSRGFKAHFKREEILSLSSALINMAIKRAKRVRGAEEREAVRYIEKEIKKYKLSKDLPSGPIHVDIKPDNSLFVGNRLQGVVDFDNAYQGPLILDLGVTMSWYGIADGRVNPTKVKKLYKAYSKARKLNDIEKKNLFNAFHFAILRNSLRALEFLAQGRLPQRWVHGYLVNYLAAERNFKMSRQEFLNYLTK